MALSFSTALVPFTQTTESFVKTEAQKAIFQQQAESNNENETISIVSTFLPLSQTARLRSTEELEAPFMEPMLEMAATRPTPMLSGVIQKLESLCNQLQCLYRQENHTSPVWKLQVSILKNQFRQKTEFLESMIKKLNE